MTKLANEILLYYFNRIFNNENEVLNYSLSEVLSLFKSEFSRDFLIKEDIIDFLTFNFPNFQVIPERDLIKKRDKNREKD